MTEDEVVKIFQKAGALLDGHFILRSGLHSSRFFQAALILQYPDIAEKLCAELAENFKGMGVQTVISPAVGGLIVGQEVARALGVKAIFADKENDQLVLKRGFTISKGEKILVAEDVITRGGRILQAIELARSFGADVVGVAVIADRSSGNASIDVPLKSIIELELPTYQPDACPLCKQGIRLVKPGSKS
ncbi:MAG: orotate phosphoribosyltransferase [Lentisphaerae bacterium GWF2_45_14]|nr:MAG: orotate phosphoribosyltransferase [Lentisphaerae bacterium GWF2_45_14]